MTMLITFLGTGGSMGVPVIGCNCSTCLSSDKKNKRLRSSILIETGQNIVLCDPSPDFREQAIKHQIDRIDGVIITHTHYDHIAGVDDLRIFNCRMKKAIPMLIERSSYEEFKLRYSYLMDESDPNHYPTARFTYQILEETPGIANFLGLPLNVFSYFQNSMKVIGFRQGKFAYVTDIKVFDEGVYQHLEGVEILVISALREEKSYGHLSIDEAIAFSNIVQAKTTYLVHMGHEVDHDLVQKKLPTDVFLAYDGLKIQV